MAGFFTQNSPYPKEATQEIVREDPTMCCQPIKDPLTVYHQPCTDQTTVDHEHAEETLPTAHVYRQTWSGALSACKVK